MGLFGKKKKEEKLKKEFELPPPPPPIGEDEGLPEFPPPPPTPSEKPRKAKAGPELPPPPPVRWEEEPKAPEKEEPKPATPSMPAAPRMPPQPKPEIRPLPKIHEVRKAPQPRPHHPLHEMPAEPEYHERAAKKPHTMPQGPVFVRAENYQGIINSINSIKAEMKQADDVVLRLDELEKERGNAFKRWREQLEDVQRKLIFVDKSLFEG
ncbi:hypothetical protein GF351_04595 [Candidatus Woesearchaeota archaeon]|nr:hypothetical protein [Candidatus Woesearchaeota archaeon]